MTFTSAPWAVNGAQTTAALARLATYAFGGGRGGIVKPGDLKVSALGVPGNGLQIAAGGAIVLNRYQATPREAYTVSNPSTHTVLAADMPPSTPALSYYLVCVVVGDPEFSQTGHPFMPSSIDPEDAPTYQYVRPVIVPCNSDTVTFDQLGLNYPAYALARLAIPASTTTITNAMITDLRELSKARESRVVLAGTPTTGQQATSGGFVNTWNSYKPSVAIPVWATRVTVTVTISQVAAVNAVVGQLRAKLGTITSSNATYDFNDTGNAIRTTIVFTLADADVTALAGTTQQLSIESMRTSGDGFLETRTGSQVIYDVQFSERAS